MDARCHLDCYYHLVTQAGLLTWLRLNLTLSKVMMDFGIIFKSSSLSMYGSFLIETFSWDQWTWWAFGAVGGFGVVLLMLLAWCALWVALSTPVCKQPPVLCIETRI